MSDLPNKPSFPSLARLLATKRLTEQLSPPPSKGPAPIKGPLTNHLEQLAASIRLAAETRPAPSKGPAPRVQPVSAFARSHPVLPNVFGPLPPTAPTQTSYSHVARAQGRFEKRLSQLKEVVPVGNGRVLPDTEDLSINDARRLKGVSVLFLDICRFSTIESGDEAAQDQVFTLLALFMSEMLYIVRAYEGSFEKNTGDGLMAYFGDQPEAECAKRAVEAAITMHCYNDHVISPKLAANGLPKIEFRVGIDTGLLTIAKIGVRGDHNSLVAVGNVPNVACKLMTLLKERDGIVLGHHTRTLLPDDWKGVTKEIEPLPKFVILGTQTQYPAWELTYRAPNPMGAVPGGLTVSGLYGSLSGLAGNKGGLGGDGGKGGPLGGIGGFGGF
jgi:adenylate cyclase